MQTPSTQLTRAQKRPCHPRADQAELAYRIGRDAFTLHLERTYADAPDPVGHELLSWIEDLLSYMQRPGLPLDALREAAECWRRRREAYFSDTDWAEVHVVEPLDRPPPSLWWRIRRGGEPVPPRGGG